MSRSIRLQKVTAVLVAAVMIISSLVFQISANADDTIAQTTILDPNNFDILPDSVDLTIDGDSFTIQKNENCAVNWPHMTMDIRVDLDKVPIFGFDLGETQTNTKLFFTNKATGESLNAFTRNMNNTEELSPQPNGAQYEFSFKDCTDWSGVVDLTMTVQMSIYDGQPVDGTDTFNKLYFADAAGTGGKVPINKTTNLDPNDFIVLPDSIDLTVDGDSFTMEKAATCGITWPDMTMNVRADLDEVPILSVDVAEAQTNYKILLENKTTGENFNFYSKDVLGYERSPGDPVGLTEVNLKETFGWSGVNDLTIRIFWIYYDGQGTTNTYNKIFFADKLGTGGEKPVAPPDPVIPTIEETTILDPNDFDVLPGSVDLTVDGDGFTMKKAADCAVNWPHISMMGHVDLDKVPIFGIEVLSAQANYKVTLTNVATNETINVYSQKNDGFEMGPNDPLGITEINVKELTGWSGVVELLLTINMIHEGEPGPINTFGKIYFADQPGTQEDKPLDPSVPVIEETTILDPNDFVVNEGKINLDTEGSQFGMTFDTSNDITWPSIAMTKNVDLSKTPIMMVNVLDVHDNYRITVINVTENKSINFFSGKDDGYERSPLDPYGVTRLDLTEIGFSAKPVELKIVVYYNKYKADAGTNTFGSIAFESPDNPVDTSDQVFVPEDCIDTPTTINPEIFSWDPHALNLVINENAFTMQKAETAPSDWPNLDFEVTVDLDKVPYLRIDVADAQANYKVAFKVKGSEQMYNFYSDTVAYECSPREIGLKELNLIEKMGVDGIVTLQFQIHIVVVEYDKASINTFNYIQFADAPLPKDDGDGEGDGDGDGDEEDRTDPWEFGENPWSGDAIQDDAESITYEISGVEDEDKTPQTGVNGVMPDASLSIIGIALLTAILLQRKAKKKKAE